MARTVKEEQYAEKRNEILDAAQRLIYTKGFERMTVQDLLAELKISSGAFYHYFESKPVLLEALIERMQEQVEQPLLPLVNDPHLSALDKLQRFFGTLDQSRTAQKAFIADLARVWFADENAIVREKVDAALVARRAPLLNAIIRQGIQEGVFTTPYPDQAGEIILALARGMGNTIARMMIAFVQNREEKHYFDKIAATYDAYSDTLERMLGAPSGFLRRPDAAAIREWLDVSDGGQ